MLLLLFMEVTADVSDEHVADGRPQATMPLMSVTDGDQSCPC